MHVGVERWVFQGCVLGGWGPGGQALGLPTGCSCSAFQGNPEGIIYYPVRSFADPHHASVPTILHVKFLWLCLCLWGLERIWVSCLILHIGNEGVQPKGEKVVPRACVVGA